VVAKRFLTPNEVWAAAGQMIASAEIMQHDVIWGVPRGGVPVALMVAGRTGAAVAATPAEATVIVDDVYDNGATFNRHTALYPEARFAVLIDKREAPWTGRWVVFPWEATEDHDSSSEDWVIRLLQSIGEDVTREGLVETPGRVVRAWAEWASGYNVDPSSVLKTFHDGATNELVIVHNIPVVSKCEHHLADITGLAHVGYIPNGRIVGLSKLPRLVDVFARRLQVQERITGQIADALMEHLRPLGAGVLIRASHACMSGRGVKIHGSVTTTSAMRGVLFDKPEARAEFLALCRDAETSR
jgi:GTP cyclohydrolase IA